MSSLQRCELLTKGQIFKDESLTSPKASQNRTGKEPNDIYHATLLSHSACGQQLCILLKSQSDRLLANHRDKMVGARGFEPPTPWSRTGVSENLKPCGCRTYKHRQPKNPASVGPQLVHKVPLVVPGICIPKPTFLILILGVRLSPFALISPV